MLYKRGQQPLKIDTTNCVLPSKLGVKWARRTSHRKLTIGISAWLPTFTWILLLLSTRSSSQPTGLCLCCLVPPKTCAGAVFSVFTPQVTILSHSSCHHFKWNTGSMSERGTRLEKVCFRVVLMGCSLKDKHESEVVCFSGPKQLLTIKYTQVSSIQSQTGSYISTKTPRKRS